MEISGYPNYLIYEDGRVYSKKTKRFLKPNINSEGYFRVGLCKNNRMKTFKIHRLICLHYLPNPEFKKEVDHINRIRNDNRLENLRWSTRSENSINREIQRNNKLGVKNIRKYKYGYRIQIDRNKNIYTNAKKTLEEAIIQRDLMLSMWMQ